MTTMIPTHARFILANGREIPVNGTVSIGRSVENSIKLDGDGVSRKHAMLNVLDGKYLLKDLNSNNGTYVNSRKLNGEVELSDGDSVRIGDNVLTFKGPVAAVKPTNTTATMVWQHSEPLTLIRGDNAEFGLNRNMRLGRASDNDLQLVNDTSASQNHAKIDVVAGQAIVSDLGSRNGTWVNGKRIGGPTRINHGDKLRVGDTIFRLRVGSQAFTETEAHVKPNTAMGLGLFLGGGVLTLAVAGLALAVVGVLFAGWYVYLRPTETPGTGSLAAEPTIEVVNSATQQAGGEQAALRALVFIVSPVGDPDTTEDAATGSGSLINDQGYVLTNFHVVGDEQGRLYNTEGWALIGINWDNPADAPNTFYRAEVEKSDPDIDLALLHIVAMDDGSSLPDNLAFPYIAVGDSDQLQLGDPIAVIGFPGLGGDTPTLTRGSVSGFLLDDINNLSRGWIKTDAEINPGNSGGMAINSRGELIGVPTQAYTGTEITGKISEIRPIKIALEFLGVEP
jgi:pSer/pThr/pTyr-binding forkhead associated (FHA) protein